MIALPEEVLLLIFEEFRAQRGKSASGGSSAPRDKLSRTKTLAAVCCTSRTFDRLARPILYRSFKYSPFDHTHRKLRLFLLSIMKNRYCANAVQTLSLRVWAPSPNDDSREQTSLPGEETDKAMSGLLAGHFRLPWRICKSLKAGLRSRDIQVDTAMLMLFCPNVVCLKLKFINFPASRDYATISNLTESLPMQVLGVASEACVQRHLHMLQGQPSYSTNGGISEFYGLRELCLKADPSWKVHADQVRKLLCFPTLKKLQARRIGFEGVVTLGGAFAGLTNIQILSLGLHHINSRALHLLLTACPTLESLSLHWQYNCFRYINFDGIGQCLRALRSRHSLTHLALLDNVVGVSTRYNAPPLGDLSTLTSLQSLTAAPVALFGVELDVFEADDTPEQANWIRPHLVQMLPSSLTTLEILRSASTSRQTKRLDAQIAALMTNQKFAQLRTIKIHDKSPFNGITMGASWWFTTEFEYDNMPRTPSQTLLVLIWRYRSVAGTNGAVLTG